MSSICLIAAHDPWFIQLLRIYSEECDFKVVQAFEGQDVIPVVHEHRPSVILLQIDLPGQIKGKEILQTLQADELASPIPVIVFSWQGSSEEEFAGVENQLQEPVTYETFVEALEKAGVLPLKGRLSARAVNSSGLQSSAGRKSKIRK
jgi:DNA-binding response OmpR family regulator